MEKAVLISIHPEWCQKIANGKKTIEVRKTRPKLKPPFRCYIYCTGGNIIGEFICRKIDRVTHVGSMGSSLVYPCICAPGAASVSRIDDLLNASCLSAVDLERYLAGSDGYGWHISNLEVYDTPRDLGEFIGLRTMKNGFELRKLDRPPQSWYYVAEKEN